jgi:hypothetical protein
MSHDFHSCKLFFIFPCKINFLPRLNEFTKYVLQQYNKSREKKDFDLQVVYVPS